MLTSVPTHRRRPRRVPAWRSIAAALLVLAAAACGGTDPVAAPSTSDAPQEQPAPADARPEPSAGCSLPPNAASLDERTTLTVDGTERWYLRTVPARAPGGAPVPLVLDFHGLAEGAEFHNAMSGFSALAQDEGFALAVPQGTGTPAAWSIAADATNPDVRFVAALIDELAATACIDLRRIHATGLSNGALLSSTLACVLSDRIASIAPVAGLADPPGCAPTRPVSVLAFHGTDDAILLFNGGVGDLGAALQGGSPALPPGYVPDVDGPGTPAAVRAWAQRNGCGPTPVDTRPAADVLVRSYDCAADTSVDFVIVEGGGHSWPGSDVSRSLETVVGRTTTSIDATTAAWEFFEQHPRTG